jgi:hypothetical protein
MTKPCKRRVKGFSIPPTVSPRILIGRPGQTREEIIAEANAVTPIDPNRPTMIVHVATEPSEPSR